MDFYEFLILAYIIMSWFPIREGGIIYDIGMVLRQVCEPWLGLFRRIIPPMGGIDFSPIIAILVLNILTRLVIGLLL